MAETRVYYEGLGRRKEATARVRLYPDGEGSFVLNNKPIEEYFTRTVDQVDINQPFQVTGTEGRFDVSVKVNGGGVSGQAGAVRLGIARALLKADPEYRKVLREHGMLTRDAREKERRKAAFSHRYCRMYTSMNWMPGGTRTGAASLVANELGEGHEAGKMEPEKVAFCTGDMLMTSSC